GTERVDSRSLFTDGHHPVIFLNSRLLGDRQRFSLAYELGQLVMHSAGFVPLERDIGREANHFAAEFLMPRETIMKDFENGVTLPLLGELKKKWKVSMIALLYRADDLGCITPNQKRYLLQQFNQLQIRRREPIELDITVELPALMKKWIAEYRLKTGLGLPEMAALLCLNIDEFLDLYA
ncbi:MAG TPA: ImmA/IrrE family metallo-endopeptidase, partial [Flavisolibacter sp.]|nr:ImmA/IrrE family metallo-endopeptidase [Flavisolibacter sp.]